MEAREVPAWQLPLLVKRRLLSVGVAVDAQVAFTVAQDILACLADEVTLPQAAAVAWAGDVIMLAVALKRVQVRSIENRLLVAAAHALEEPVPSCLGFASPGLKRAYQVLARFQRLVGDEPIHPGQPQLAAVLGCSQPQVSAYLSTFETLELIACVDAKYIPGVRAKHYRVRLGEGAS